MLATCDQQVVESVRTSVDPYKLRRRTAGAALERPSRCSLAAASPLIVRSDREGHTVLQADHKHGTSDAC
jgi:hypothetical protein